MKVNPLRDLCSQKVIRLTLKFAKQISTSTEMWSYVFDTWSYISVVMPPNASSLFYKLLNKYAHWLSHDCKVPQTELREFPTLTADEVFNMLATCQSPKMIFDYKMKRQRMIPQNVMDIARNPNLAKYFETRLTELDLSGADFCCDDALVVLLLPKCHSLQVLCLGNSGSEDVLNAARSCPLIKLQLEERFPLAPKLPQDTVLKYLLGGDLDSLNLVLEICKLKSEALLEYEALEDEGETVKQERIQTLKDFVGACEPSWPNMKVLIFGNCRICREALFLCLVVLRSLEEISIHRIQSDEILNTCNRVFNSLGLEYKVSLTRLSLWAGWSGFENDALKIAPNVDKLTLVVYSYSDFRLKETIEKNETLKQIDTLSLIGLRYAGPNIFLPTNHFLGNIWNLQISGVILTTEELVNIFTCFPNLVRLQLDYSELRNYNYVIRNQRYRKSLRLEHFSVESSFVDREFLDAVMLMSTNMKRLIIKGKTRSFVISLADQELFLLHNESSLQYLELYPEYPLHIEALLSLARKNCLRDRMQLHIPVGSLSIEETTKLVSNGWHIIPACSRC